MLEVRITGRISVVSLAGTIRGLLKFRDRGRDDIFAGSSITNVRWERRKRAQCLEKRGGILANRKIAHATSIGPFVAACLISCAATAHESSTLWLKNIDSQPVTMTLSTENSNCYEGEPGLGRIWQNLAPGAQVKMTLWRVQGHGCDGDQGEFEIVFDPGVGAANTQHFDFDNDGGLELTERPPNPNIYPGALVQNGDRVYTYSTHKTEYPSVVGASVGSWKLICQQICNRTLTEQKSKEHNTTTRLSTETTKRIAISLEAGVEMEGVGSAKTTVESSEEKKIGREMSESVTNGELNIDTSNYVFSPEQMKSFDIFAIWQWVATTKLSDGEQIMIGSNKFTCTPDAVTPTYYPGSAQDIKACRGGDTPNP
jgi:hypothetical protein